MLLWVMCVGFENAFYPGLFQDFMDGYIRLNTAAEHTIVLNQDDPRMNSMGRQF